MIDSGAATHVCPTWFAPDTPLYTLEQGQGPQLRTATEDIPVHGYKWAFMKTRNSSTLVVPFYVCDMKQPIMSVTRLAEQGFNTTLSEEAPALTHTHQVSRQPSRNAKDSTSFQQQPWHYPTT